MRKLSLFIVLIFSVPLLSACCGPCPSCPPNRTTVVTPPGEHVVVTPDE